MATAFAVFCATDGSLTFYNRDTVPNVGSTFEGKVASNVYTGFENIQTNSSTTTVPWYNEMASIISVSFTSEFSVVKPRSVANWFNGATSLASFDGTNLDTSNSIYIRSMFNNCKTLTILDVSNFNTGKLTDMSSMFMGCSALTSLDITSFDTSKVTDMFSMFSGCSALTSLDITSFDTSKVTDMSDMFSGCSALKTIHASERWSTTTVTSGAYMFTICRSLVGAVPYDSAKTDASMANYETGYFTYKRYVVPKDMFIKNTTLYDIADKIRILNGSEEDMTPAEMIITLSNIRDAKEVAF